MSNGIVHWLKFASPASFYPLAGRMIPWFTALAVLFGVAGLWVSFFVAPTDATQGEGYRIIFVHVPASWMSMVIYLVMAAWAGIGLALNARLSHMMAQALAPTGALMAFLSLLPAIGAALIWGPVAIYFLAVGAIGKSLGLVFVGVFVIGLVDNILRPLLVGKDTQMPDYVVLMSTIGGIALFGINGFVIGPVIAAVFLVSWEMLASARQQSNGPPP